MKVKPLVLAQNLEVLIRKNDLSKADLSRQSGVPRQSINDWLGGRSPRNLGQLKSVAGALGVDIDQLCFGNVEIDNKGQNAMGEGVNNALSRFRDPALLVNFEGEILAASQWMHQYIPELSSGFKNITLGMLFHFEDRLRLRQLLTATIKQGIVDYECDSRVLSSELCYRTVRWYCHLDLKLKHIFLFGRDLSDEIEPSRITMESFPGSRLVNYFMDLSRADKYSRKINLQIDGTPREVWYKSYYGLVTGIAWAHVTRLFDCVGERHPIYIHWGDPGRPGQIEIYIKQKNPEKCKTLNSILMTRMLELTGVQIQPILEDKRTGFILEIPLA